MFMKYWTAIGLYRLLSLFNDSGLDNTVQYGTVAVQLTSIHSNSASRVLIIDTLSPLKKSQFHLVLPAAFSKIL